MEGPAVLSTSTPKIAVLQSGEGKCAFKRVKVGRRTRPQLVSLSGVMIWNYHGL
jgi:hypothetical protein